MHMSTMYTVIQLRIQTTAESFKHDCTQRTARLHTAAQVNTTH